MARTIKKTTTAWLIALSTLAVFAWPASRAGAEDLSFGLSSTPQSLLAMNISMRARQVLTSPGEIQPDQFVMARVLMDQALKLDPRAADRWLLRGELAIQMKDQPALVDALEHYCRLRPRDDAAQLRLILASLERFQTLDERLAMAERILNAPSAQQLSEPLRSRLASYAAQSAREMGDTQRFGSWLVTALKLDSSNTQAAKLAYEFAVSRNASPGELGVAAMAMIRANPLDPAARNALASLLLSQAAYGRAAEQFAAARAVTEAPLGAADVATTVPGRVVSLAANGQTDDALALLTQVESLPAQAAPGSAAAAPVVTKLPMDLELIRLAIYAQSGQASAATGSFGRLRDQLHDRQKSGDASAAIDLAWVSVLFNRNLDEAAQLLKDAPDNLSVRRARAWLALRHGEIEQARAALTAMAGRDSFALYGLAQLYDRADQPERLDDFRRVVAMDPSSLAGMMAAHDLTAAGETIPISEQGVTLVAQLTDLPKGLASPSPRDQPLILMQLALDPTEYGYLDPIEAHVLITNNSDLPLSVGAGGAVPTRLVIFISTRHGGGQMTDTITLVEDVGRCLRIEPRKVLDVPVRLDHSPLGMLFMVAPFEEINFSLVAVLDPRPSPTGTMVPSMFGARDTLGLIQRHTTSLSAPNIDLWLAALSESADPVERFKALAILYQSAPRLSGDSPEAVKLATRIGAAINDSYAHMNPLAQAWGLSFMPNNEKARPIFAPALEVARRSEDPLVELMYLQTQVTDPASPDMNAALRQSGVVGEFAKAYSTNLSRIAKAANQVKGDQGGQPSPAGSQ